MNRNSSKMKKYLFSSLKESGMINSGMEVDCIYAGILHNLKSLDFDFKYHNNMMFCMENRRPLKTYVSKITFTNNLKYVYFAAILHIIFENNSELSKEVLTLPILRLSDRYYGSSYSISNGYTYFLPKRNFSKYMAEASNYVLNLYGYSFIHNNPKLIKEYNNYIFPGVVDFLKFIERIENREEDI